MKIEKISKDSFVVIGKEGSTLDGNGFIQRLWQDANTHFDEITDLAKKDESGCLVGVWGAMTDFSRSLSLGMISTGGFIWRGQNAGMMQRPLKDG